MRKSLLRNAISANINYGNSSIKTTKIFEPYVNFKHILEQGFPTIFIPASPDLALPSVFSIIHCTRNNEQMLFLSLRRTILARLVENHCSRAGLLKLWVATPFGVWGRETNRLDKPDINVFDN